MSSDPGGMDEMTAERRENDPFINRLIKCTLLEEATIMITSRSHACENLDASRRVEVVGFGKKEIREFVEKAFPNDITSVNSTAKGISSFREFVICANEFSDDS